MNVDYWPIKLRVEWDKAKGDKKARAFLGAKRINLFIRTKGAQ